MIKNIQSLLPLPSSKTGGNDSIVKNGSTCQLVMKADWLSYLYVLTPNIHLSDL